MTAITSRVAREWSAVDVTRAARSAKLLDDSANDKETRAGFDHQVGARDAYTDRTGVVVDVCELAQLRVVVVSVAGAADDATVSGFA